MEILYSLITGLIALIKPPMINNEERQIVIINDHLRKRRMFLPSIIPGIFKATKIISDNRKNRKAYSMNASQKPPSILNMSEINEECFDSRILAAMKIIVSKKKVVEYRSL